MLGTVYDKNQKLNNKQQIVGKQSDCSTKYEKMGSRMPT